MLQLSGNLNHFLQLFDLEVSQRLIKMKAGIIKGSNMHSRPICRSNAKSRIFYSQTLIFRKVQFFGGIVIDFRIRFTAFKLCARDNFFKIMMNVIFGQNPVNNRQTGGGGQGSRSPIS